MTLSPVVPVMHSWSAFARDTSYAPSAALPIRSVSGVLRHLGVGTAILTTPYTPDAWGAVGPGGGITLYRDGGQVFTGLTSARQIDWDRTSGLAIVKVEAVGDAQHLADALAFPDPLRAADDQTVNDYWTGTGVASTAMRQLISDQIGPTAASVRRVSGLTMGADPGVGISRTWQGLFDSAGPNQVLDLLASMSVASGQDLGVRFTSTSGSLTVDIIAPRDLSASVQFSADLSNLVAFTYREQAPTVTDAVAAGQGDLHARLRKWVTTSSSDALSWGRRIWRYVDRRDTADTTVLTQAATDAATQGDVTVNLQVTLTDSQAATWRTDWDLGDRVTVHVGLPGQDKVAVVSDVVREISFQVNENGAETIQPAVGSYDAKAIIPTPTQRQILAVGAKLAAVARK